MMFVRLKNFKLFHYLQTFKTQNLASLAGSLLKLICINLNLQKVKKVGNGVNRENCIKFWR